MDDSASWKTEETIIRLATVTCILQIWWLSPFTFSRNIACYEGPPHRRQLRGQEHDRSRTGRLARNPLLRPGHGSRSVFSDVHRSSPSPMREHARLSHQGVPCLESPSLADRRTRLCHRPSPKWADG